MEENRAWQARWIWTEGLPRTETTGEHQAVYFRRAFEVPADRQCRLVVDVSADSRYRLYLNGESVSVGPCKGNDRTHYYETVDLSDRLQPGKNILAARVIHYAKSEPFRMGIGGPISIWRSFSGGFFLEAALVTEGGVVLDNLSSDEKWKCMRDAGFSYAPSSLMQWLGGLEKVDGALLPHGWERIEFVDDSWQQAVPFYDTRNPYGELTPWRLTKRPIPPLFETRKMFRRITRWNEAGKPSDMANMVNAEMANINDNKIASLFSDDAGQPLTLQPRQKLWVELDAGELTTGYLRLELKGGAGSTVRILCAECYEDEKSLTSGERIKGVRNRVEGCKLVGDYDTYRIAGHSAGTGAGAAAEAYEPFWFRTFRYVRLEIEVAEYPLTIESFHYRETGYPLEVQSSFDCSDPEYRKLWELSLNTLRRCMHETYEDCPYYEQLQYTMDTRLQMLFTYNVAMDDRMARRTIHDYHSSALPSGMLQCRYPSVYAQVIPSFSLYWIHMLYDHYQYFGDKDLVKRYRPTAAALLDWFEQMLTPQGIVGVTPYEYWTHFDWVDRWDRGAPLAWHSGPVTLHTLMYSAALQKAAELFAATGWSDAAAEYRERAVRLNRAVREQCWSADKNLFQDGPGLEEYSQHAQIWSVLSGAVTGEEARALLERTIHDGELAKVSLPMSYFLFRALSAYGMYNKAFAQWDRWKVFVGQNLTTLPEIAHAVPRSDCHAWSAVPLSEFPAEILGVRPGAPGYGVIVVAPQTGNLMWAKGTVATKRGMVAVDWDIDEAWTFTVRIEAPTGAPVSVQLPDGSGYEYESEPGVVRKFSCGLA